MKGRLPLHFKVRLTESQFALQSSLWARRASLVAQMVKESACNAEDRAPCGMWLMLSPAETPALTDLP